MTYAPVQRGTPFDSASTPQTSKDTHTIYTLDFELYQSISVKYRHYGLIAKPAPA